MKRMFKNSLFSLLTLISLIINALGVTPARAAAITVTSTADSGPGSLRQTIADAAAGDTITFDSSLSGQTITLTSGQLVIDKNLTINGLGMNELTISGSDASRVFYIDPDVTVSITGLGIANGHAPDNLDFGAGENGGGIYNNGDLTLQNCDLHDNRAGDGNLTDGMGGGGGGIFNAAGVLTLQNCELHDNQAGHGGMADGLSGGVYGGTITISDSALYANSGNGGGGIYSYLTLTISNSTFYANSGGAGAGGAIFIDGGTATVSNSTFSDNSASYYAGGIYNHLSTLHLINTILANSTGGDCATDTGLATNTKNLIEDGSCSPFLSGDPKLGLPMDNGGFTKTMALLDGSSAIDAGDNDVCVAAPVSGFDQRGYARGASCDIGAYEVQPDTTPPVVTVPGNITAEAASASGAAVNFVVNAQDDVDGTLTPTCDFNSGDTFPLGATTVSCSATDAASNTGSASFNIIMEDTTAPDTAIDSHPANPSSTSAAVFTFSGSDSASNIASFECRVDAGSFAVCASGDNFGPLSAGPHTFEVRALDAAGNTDPSPASFSWTINILIVKSIAAHNGWVLESGENTGLGASNIPKTNGTILVGDNQRNEQIRGILSFSTSALPDDAEITSAVLKFKRHSIIGGNTFFNTNNPLLVDIRKGPFNKNAQLEGKDFHAAASKSQVLTFKNNSEGDWFIKALSSSDLNFINKNGVTQFRLRFQIDDDNDRSGDYLVIFGGNAAEGNRPQLIIKYTLPAP